MTANELSKKAGVSAPTVYNLLNGGAQNPQQRTLRALEVALEEKFERTKEEEESFRAKGIGDLIDFNPYDPKDTPAKPGVYVFSDISGRPIYVGQAMDIAARLDDHLDKFWFKPPIVQTAAYIEIADKATRLQVETVLIQFLKKNAVINKNKTAGKSRAAGRRHAPRLGEPRGGSASRPRRHARLASAGAIRENRGSRARP